MGDLHKRMNVKNWKPSVPFYQGGGMGLYMNSALCRSAMRLYVQLLVCLNMVGLKLSQTALGDGTWFVAMNMIRLG